MILDVPYYSQITDTKNPKWKKDACGITTLKMILDYYSPTNLSIDELYQKGLDLGGYKEGVGWYHHSLAQLAKKFGYKAITKSWNIPTESLKKLNARGFSKKGGSGHLIVIIGFDNKGFVVHDPFDGEKIHIDFNKFKDVWSGRFCTRRAIL